MKRQYSHFLFTAAFLALLLNTVDARVAIHHHGANDPQTQGFDLQFGNAALGPVFNDLGIDAWMIHTRSGSEAAFYQYHLTQQDLHDAALHGWELSATMRLLDSQWTGTTLWFSGPDQGFRLMFSHTEEGDLFVHTGSIAYIIENDSHGYHQYTIRYDHLESVASLWVDAKEVDSDLFNFSGSSIHRVRFGASQDISHAHWHDVSFTIIPEPATVALVTGVVVLFFVGIVRRRRRKGARLSGVS